MLRLAADENFTGAILAGVLQQEPRIDIVRVQDCGIAQAADPVMLKWAARERRVIVSHDRKTLPPFAYEMVRNGDLMYGVVIVSDRMPFARAIAELLILAQCSDEPELLDRVLHLPL